MPQKVWRINAGVNSALADAFFNEKYVGIGWAEMGDLSRFGSEAEIKASFEAVYPGLHVSTVGNSVSTILRFVSKMVIGDRVLLYLPSAKVYLIGEITGGYRFAGAGQYRHVRDVRWIGSVLRDSLPVPVMYRLQGPTVIMDVPEEISVEVDSRTVLNSFNGIDSTASAAIRDAVELMIGEDPHGPDWMLNKYLPIWPNWSLPFQRLSVS